MQKLLISGKKELSGKILISGSKNATLPILAATILSNQVKLTNVPLVKDIFTMVELLRFIGLKTDILRKEKFIINDGRTNRFDINPGEDTGIQMEDAGQLILEDGFHLVQETTKRNIIVMLSQSMHEFDLKG